MNTALHEIYSTVYWNILRESVPGFVKALGENILSHQAMSHKGMPGVFLSRSHQFDPQDATYVTSNPERDIENPWYAYIDDDDEFINLVPVNGGITRNAACGFGSRAQRDQVLYAAKRPNCIGHIFLIDTPGGSAYSIEDYTEAIEAARAAGQPVLACIDGLCASAGYALACQCDSIYYTSPSNIVGCIGTMAVYATQKNGDKNTITQETYHEIYDPESTEKNIEFRQSAEGDDSLIIERLKEHGQAFRDLVSKCRPQVKDEQKKGKTYKCSEVEGTLVDGRLSLQGCIDLLASKSLISAPTDTPDTPDSPEPQDEPDSKCNPKPKCSTVPCDSSQVSNPNDQTMIETNLQTALVEAQSQLAEAQATLAEREQALADAQAALDAATASQATEHSEEIDALNTQLEAVNSEVESLNSQLSTLNTQLSDTAKDLEEANNALAAANKSLEEKEAALVSSNQLLEERAARITELEASLAEAENTISELAHEPSATATPTPATAGEGEGDGGKELPESACASKPGMSIEERRAAQAARDKALGI